MRRFLLLVLSAGLSACVRSAPPGLGVPAGVATDTVFYISARARVEGRAVAQLADTLEYGLVITRRLAERDPFEDRVLFEPLDSVSLTRAAFVSALRARVAPLPDAERFAVLYTHGYGTSLPDAWEHTYSSRLRSRGPQPWVVFAWPSIGTGIARPRNGDLLFSGYRLDSAMAVASRGQYLDAFGAVYAAVGGEQLLAVAHSLGGQLVGESLMSDAGLGAALRERPLRGLAFVSPDVEAGHFGDVLVPGLRPLTSRLVLYASAGDRVLALSRFVNDSERAGLIAIAEDGPVVRPGLETVDMTKGEYADAAWVQMFGTRHALRRKSAALFDLIQIVGGREAPSCRLTLETATQTPTGVWVLTDTAVPDPDAVLRCRGVEESAAYSPPGPAGFR